MIIPRLRPDALISVEYSDDTPFGVIGPPKLEVNLRKLFSEIRQAMEEHGPAYVVERSERLLGELRGKPDYVDILDKTDSRRIAPEVLYPEASRVKPVALNIVGVDGHQNLRLNFHPELLPTLHDLVAGLCGEDSRLEAVSADILDLYHSVLSELERRDMVLPRDSDVFAYEESNRREWTEYDATFVGHNTVVVRSQTTQIVVDPWLFPAAGSYPDDYQPVLRPELGKIDALLITHSHPDHFDPGTLLQFGRQTKIIVPKVERESLLATDMALRLRELGFQDVQTMDWWEEKRIGDVQVIALPFYGEQPTNGEQLCPEVRNMGNTYLVRTPRFSCAFVADSGRDRQGDVKDVALEAYRHWGQIDVLFTGYRGWYLYPIQYVESSVRRYLLFIPPELYTARQSIMNGASDAVDTAEVWHARYLAPYADGGAPWYWEIGLGPVLSSIDDGSKPKEWLYFDPLPERCLEELRVRSAPTPDTLVGSPVLPLLLRPGQSLRLVDGEPQIAETERHRWPWAVSEQETG